MQSESGQMPEAQLAQVISEYERDGIAVIKSVFGVDEISALRSAAFMALTELESITRRGYKGRALETVETGRTRSPALIFWPALANEVLDEFRRDPRLQTIVRSLLGPDVKQLNNQVYFRLPGDADSFAWHQDIMFRMPREDYPGIVEANAYLQTAIVVDPIRQEGGAIEYVVGSHEFGDLGSELPGTDALRGFDAGRLPRRLAQLTVKAYEADPGDVMIWSALTVHGSAANRSGSHRMYYMNGFARAECCRPWPYYLKRGRIRAIDARKLA